MSFAEILDMGFRLLRDHFILVVGLGATLQVPLALVEAWSGGKLGLQPPAGAAFISGAITLLAVLGVAPIVGAAVTYAIGDAYVGRPPTIGRALRRAFAIVVPLTGTMLLIGLIVILVTLVLVAPALVAFFAPSVLPVSPRLLLAGGLVLNVFAWTHLWLGFLVVTQVMMLEATFGRAALRRSRFLMRGNRMRGAGITFLGAVIVGVLGGVLELALGYVPVVGAAAAGVAQAAGTAYTSAVLVVFYFDIRCRKEAFDLEHLAMLVTRASEASPSLAVSAG
jgi:hypothetical protein